MKKIEVSVLIAFIFSIVLSNLLIFFEKYDKLKDSVIRVHILANSNSKEDQLLKYKIKDDVSSKISVLLKNTRNKDQAKKIILDNIDYLKTLTRSKIKKNGYDYNIDIRLTKSYFTTRKYDGFVLPAGNYDAIKIIIGEGKGANWWCVAFPPMCSPVYNNNEKNKEILGSEQLEMITKPCNYKFAIIEFIENIINHNNK
ncbi:MAG: stage II sporulation protein R [Oscillospiraceae bacterium]|nr:stage II sporulation protein R [Oscillospiraceae bacterium]